MTDEGRGSDTWISESGGTVRRFSGAPARPAGPDLTVLAPLRPDPGEPTRPAGVAPYLRPGDVVTWRHGRYDQLLRVVSDDDRGLVAWLPTGSEQQARHDLVSPRAWPLDQGWETWHPPAAWDEPLVFPRGTMGA